MLTWTDSHTHADFYKTPEERADCMQRALAAGVNKLIVPGVDSSTIESVVTHCQAYPLYCFPAIGLHPTEVKENYMEELAILEKTLHSPKVRYYAIGEVGMDLYWETQFIEEQKLVLRKQIEWAIQYHLPLIFHVRKAFEESMQILKDYKNENLQGVFHCFSGSVEQAQRIVDQGFYLGIGGVLTFKNSSLPLVVKALPIDAMLLETDAPYLAPSPYRGKENESAYIPLIGAKLAEIKGLSIEEVARITRENADRLFFS
ncbi:MAG: TatD family hydrolase [Bacteroidales bacterium]